MEMRKTILKGNVPKSVKKTGEEDKSRYYSNPGKEHENQPMYCSNPVEEGLYSSFRGKQYEDVSDEKVSAYGLEPKKIKIGDFNVELRLPLESKDWVWEKGRLQVNVTSNEGKEYYADFVTLKYIKEVLDKKFPELGNGNYFLGKDKIIIKDLDENTVRNTLEDLILNWKDSLEEFFERR